MSALKIEDIPELCRKNCYMKSPNNVLLKINDLIDGGPKQLQVVSDFDFTITKQHLETNEKVLTSFGMFDKCQSIPQSYREESFKLFQKYRPLEIDPHISIDEKINYMIEWWTKTGELLKGFKFDITEIDTISDHYENVLRDGCQDMFKELCDLNVPVLVFSAGLGDCVVSVLKQANVYYPNVKVVSNFLQFRDGVLNGLQEKMIHAFNKNETALEGTEYYDLVHERDHVIVMGDSLGDADMANGVPSQSHLLKIGFLYDHVSTYVYVI